MFKIINYKHFLLAFVLLTTPLVWGQTERIESYHSEIVVQENCDVIITETIRAYSSGYKIKRGIYRDLPLSYLYNGGNVHVGFELLSIKRDGFEESYKTEDLSNGIRIYIGKEDFLLLDGWHDFEIKYKVNHVLGFFDEYDEIYWNINGNGWDFSIDTISATVSFPKGAKLTQEYAYTGVYGSSEKDYSSTKNDNSVSFITTRRMHRKENLTVAVAWEKNHLIYPSSWDNFMFWLKSYVLYFVGGFGLIVGLILNLFTWKKHGVDPKKGTIIPLFNAPKDFSPGECAYLDNEGRVTDSMFGAMLIYLATKKLLTIETEKKGLIIKSTIYTITKLKTTEVELNKLNDIETEFYDDLFGMRDSFVIQKGKYDSKLERAQDSLRTNIDEKQVNKYFVRNNNLKARQFLMPLFTFIVGLILYYFLGGNLVVLIIAVVLLLIVNFIFARLYEQPTKEGRKKMDEIEGFSMYMKYADKERIKLMNPPTMNFTHFEANLAFAIALDVAEEWADKFDPVMLKNEMNMRMPFFIGMSMTDIGSFGNDLSSTISSASTPPSSSGSGSGGGGFSGGGGGGGGGGGW